MQISSSVFVKFTKLVFHFDTLYKAIALIETVVNNLASLGQRHPKLRESLYNILVGILKFIL